jgi:hypothetical protein
MRVGNLEVVFDCVTVFRKFLYLSGWFHDWSGKDEIANIEIIGPHILFAEKKYQMPHGGVVSLGPNKGFEGQFLLSKKLTDLSARVVITTKSGKRIDYSLNKFCEDRRDRFPTNKIQLQFRQLLKDRECKNLLDLGGRDRSRLDRSAEFTWLETTVVDILPGENVDVVGDAHELSTLIPGKRYDAIMSMFVFEHLAMPWRVLVEMNRIMNVGAIGYIVTHQTVGMHDMPWDFWRFSDTSWDFLINKRTGFKILDRAMADEMFLLPFVCNENMIDAENSAGFYFSSVLFEKISEADVDWPVQISEVTESMYPAGQN